MSLGNIVTPLDSAVLDSKEQYVFYHKMVDFTLKELIVAVQNKQILNKQEVLLFKQYSDLLLYSIEAMRVKYMYDDEESMKVDLTDSSFPNYLEFRYLFNDLELREEYLGKLTNIDTLKEEFLDTLMRKKESIAKRKLFQATSIVYYTSAKKEYIFNRFVQGKLKPLGMHNTYYCSNSKVIKNKAYGYDYSPKGLQQHQYLNHKWPYAAGSLCSTTEDLLIWLTALHEKKTLSDQQYQSLVTPNTLSDGSILRYGMGISNFLNMGHQQISHGGGIPGFLTDTRYFPDADLYIIALVNTAGPHGGGYFADKITWEILEKKKTEFIRKIRSLKKTTKWQHRV